VSAAGEAASRRWEYRFGVETAGGADPAMTMLIGVLGWPTLVFTFTAAQFAAFKKSLEKHGIELTGVSRLPSWDEPREGED
jgi:hypothetical protein